MATDPSKIYALLIGINAYLDNRMPENFYYRNLQGSVKDILDAESFLQKSLRVPQSQIITLTSSIKGDASDLLTCKPDELVEPPDLWPTYQNIVRAFRQMEESVSLGDQIYIHYSGHGGRTATLPEFYPFKGEKSLDETLVPCDIGQPDGQLLRDIEMAYLLQRLVAKNCHVTIVLDSCYAGGATRTGGGALIRSIGNIPINSNTIKKPLVSAEELESVFQPSLAQSDGGLNSKPEWVLEPKGYTLIAACRMVEKAHEWQYEEQKYSGALTYYWLEALKTMGTTPTYQMVFNRVMGQVNSQFRDQTPQLQGEGARRVFSNEEIRQAPAANVMEVSSPKNIILDVGQPQGAQKKSQFAVYPGETTDFGNQEECLAIVEVIESNDYQSVARVIEPLKAQPIKVGAQALMVSPGQQSLRLDVKLGSAAEQGSYDSSEIKRSIAKCNFLRLVEENQPSKMQVSVNPEGEFILMDSGDGRIRNMHPPIKATDAESSHRLVKRLEHIAKFYNVRSLYNQYPASPLAGTLHVELQQMETNDDSPVPGITRPLDEVDGVKTIGTGQWALLTIRHTYSQPLNITVLNLQPDWGISQLYPGRAALYETLEKDQLINIPIKSGLPPGYKTGEDILKVFATVTPTNFRLLALQPLDQPPLTKSMNRTPGNLLEEYLSILAGETSSQRNFEAAPHVNSYWTTEHILVRMVHNTDNENQ